MHESSTERLIAKITDRIHSDFAPPRRVTGGGPTVSGAPEIEYSWAGEPAPAQDVAWLAQITAELAEELRQRNAALAAMRAMLFPGMDDDAVADHLRALADGLGIDLGDDW